MKKLISLALVVLFAWMMVPAKAMEVHAALTAPASWDYAYKYNATNDEFEFTNYAATNKNTPAYTRTANSTYYNYTYTGSGSGVLPFEVTLTFNRSNTSWKSVTEGYTSDDSKIGSDNTVGAVSRKFYLLLLNNTKNDYKFYVDLSSTVTNTISFIHKVNNIDIINKTSSQYYIQSLMTVIPSFYLPSFSTFLLEFPNSSGLFYFDAFYLKDLGVSASYTEGYNNGYGQAETDIGWTDTNSDGYDDTSFGAGYMEGYTAGYSEGYDDGYAQALVDIGWTDENDDGWDDESYEAGLMDQTAFTLGYNKGYTDGYIKGTDMETGQALNSGVMMFIGLLVAFGLMIIGFWTKARLFNLLAVAGSVFFITQFSSIAMIIMGFGLIIINLAYTFWGWKGGE